MITNRELDDYNNTEKRIRDCARALLDETYSRLHTMKAVGEYYNIQDGSIGQIFHGTLSTKNAEHIIRRENHQAVEPKRVYVPKSLRGWSV